MIRPKGFSLLTRLTLLIRWIEESCYATYGSSAQHSPRAWQTSIEAVRPSSLVVRRFSPWRELLKVTPSRWLLYALATLPLINRAKLSAGSATQCWFADDAGAGGKLQDLFNWWCVLAEKGPLYGYFVNPPKTWLVVKDCCFASATALFNNSGIQITTEGRPLLGAPLGNVDYCTSFLQSKSSSLVQEVRTLAKIARTEPQAAYSAFTHGLAGKWNYLTRVSPTFREFLEPLESTIRTEYLASLTGRCISDLERNLLHLPARLGSLAVCNPCLAAEHSFQSTSEQVRPVVDYILDPESTTLEDALAAQSEYVANARERLQKRSDASCRRRLSSPFSAWTTCNGVIAGAWCLILAHGIASRLSWFFSL